MLPLLVRYSKAAWLLISILLLAIIGCTDFLIGYQVSLSVFYAIPIIIAGVFSDRHTPVVVAALACVVWCWADIGSGHQYFTQSVHAWEISVRCAFFFAAAI